MWGVGIRIGIDVVAYMLCVCIWWWLVSRVCQFVIWSFCGFFVCLRTVSLARVSTFAVCPHCQCLSLLSVSRVWSRVFARSVIASVCFRFSMLPRSVPTAFFGSLSSFLPAR